MNVISVLVDGTAHHWIWVTVVATVGLILAVLPLVAFIYRIATRRTDRREAAEKADRDAQERARDRAQRLTTAASTATTLTDLEAVQKEIPDVRAENPPWSTAGDTLEIACAHRETELLAASIREELDSIAPALASLQLPAPTTADAIALHANVQAQQQFIEHLNAGLQQLPALARKLDRLRFITPKPPWPPHPPNTSTP